MSGSIGVHRREVPGKTYADALAQQHEERRRRQASALAQLDCLTGVPARDLLKMFDERVLDGRISQARQRGEGIEPQPSR